MKQQYLLQMNPSLTFEQLPQAVAQLTQEVVELKQLLLEKHNSSPAEQPDKLLTIQQAAELMKLTVPTMYSKVSRGDVPVMKRGKRLYFSLFELTKNIQEGRKIANPDLEKEANNYLSRSGKKIRY
jgi:hypothetical protein